MDRGLLLQYIIIALAVVISAWVVVKKQFPGTIRRMRVTMALPLLREGRPGWQRTLGRWIAPESSITSGGSSCGGCDGCGPSSKP